MTSRYLAALLALSVSRPAAAESHKLLVLQSEGRADAATRAKIDAAIFKLAAGAEPQAVAGELNFSDAATAVGCKPETALCKDEVLGMLSVDEVVITTVAPKPGGLEITVRRFAKGGASREATMLLPTGAPPDKLDGVAPLFGDKSATPAGRNGPALATAHPTSERPTSERPTGEAPVIPAPTSVAQEPVPAPTPVAAAGEPASAPVESPSELRHRLEIGGIAGGAAMTTLGLILWGAASSVQGDINKARTNTKQDLLALRNLESRGDGYAGVGNVLVITGVIAGGLATAFYIKDRRAASATSARLTPTVLDHGAGVVLTIGGTP
jgi:hypothetical protein